MSNKIGRNKEWCKAYRARGQDKINAKRKHSRLSGRLADKAEKLYVNHGLDIPAGLIRQIQHHRSLSK